MLAGGIGVLALGVLRRRYPELPRPLKLPFAMFMCLLGFSFSSMVVFWAGWESNRTIVIVLLVGVVLLAIAVPQMKVKRSELHISHSLWLIPYLGVLFTASWLSDYQGGRALIPSPWGDIFIFAWAFLMGWLAILTALPRQQSLPLMAAAFEEVKEVHGGVCLIDAKEYAIEHEL